METKHTIFVRELCKFLSGLIFADMLVGLWFYSAGLAGEQTFFGLLLTTPVINTWMVIDALLLITLIFYGWRLRLPHSSARRAALMSVGVLLAIVAVAHFARLFFSVPIVVGGVIIPFWISTLGAIITGFLSYASFHLATRR